MTPLEFRASPVAQRQLFAMAHDVRTRQQAFADNLLAELHISGTAVSILKRDDFSAFVAGVIEKTHRKGYHSISQMDDIVRGRINVSTGVDIKKLRDALEAQSMFSVKEVVPPRPRAGVPDGYPRYHIILEDPVTGITHEWQIGTQALTDVYETPGIRIPTGLHLKPGMHPDIHDIEYDIFKSIDDHYPEKAAHYGIPAFRRQVAELSAEAGTAGSATPQLEAKIAALHQRASAILQALVSQEGPAFIEQFYH